MSNLTKITTYPNYFVILLNFSYFFINISYILLKKLFNFLSLILKKNMGRNNPKNIKIHNDKLHKEQAKKKQKEMARKEKLKAIVRKFASDENETTN
jgi:hypothetical protein